jgi:hypothetical protein
MQREKRRCPTLASSRTTVGEMSSEVKRLAAANDGAPGRR